MKNETTKTVRELMGLDGALDRSGRRAREKPWEVRYVDAIELLERIADEVDELNGSPWHVLLEWYSQFMQPERFSEIVGNSVQSIGFGSEVEEVDDLMVDILGAIGRSLLVVR